MKTTSGSKRVLLQDIATATGYTVNTVSRALQNKSDIAKSTCAYIQKVADEMGYVRNNIASSLRSGRSRTLAVIVGEASNPFYAIMIDTIHDIAEENGYTVLVLCSRDHAPQEQRAIITAIGRQVDGVLLFPSTHSDENITLLRQSGIPFVLVSRHTENPDYDYVVCDEETGGYLAGKHLIEAGNRKLAFCYVNEVAFSSVQRTHGLMRAAKEAGIPEEDVRFFQYHGDAEIIRQLKQWKKEGVTGIFAFCDIEAWKLAGCLDAAGLSGDFSLMGFDNIQSIIGFPSPLCTIDGAMRELSKAAFSILIKRIHGDDSPPKAQVFPVRLVCRGSCRGGRQGG
jgi:LacI family transcriptional regulator